MSKSEDKPKQDDDSGGQNPIWPGEGQGEPKKPGTYPGPQPDETTHIPLVR